MIAEKNNDFSYWDYVIESIDANYSRWTQAYPDLRVVRTIPPELIENSQDREEVIEKDWIDEVRENYQQLCWVYSTDKMWFRKAIENNAQKQQMFSYNDISDFAVSKSKDYNQEMTVRWVLEMFLKQNNLLSTDDDND